LVETGYITNKEEEDYLNSDRGQQEIAECVSNAVKNYISWLERQGNLNISTGQASVSRATQAETMNFLKNIDEHEHSR
jgi:N-acetylmuramoyl-L-alanine amidase